MASNDDRKVTLRAEVDTTNAEAGFKRVGASAEQMASKVAREGARAGGGLQKIGADAQGAAVDMSRSERNIVGAIQRATAALQAGSKAGSEYYEALARQRGIDDSVIAPYVRQLREAEAAQKGATATMRTMGTTAGQTAAAMRMVPAQFTDIVVSLQSGQQPLTVLLQQGGQLKDMFGGIGPAARGLAGYVLGLVNPFTLAAAAAGALALAYYQGSKESDAYVRALVLSGNAAGTTAGELAEMAKSMAAVSGTQSGAAAALAQLAGTGQVAAANLKDFASVAIGLEKRAGIPIENTVRDLEELGKKPLDASVKLTEQYRYLTAEVYSQIKALEDQGRMAEAANLAQRTYMTAMSGNVEQLTAQLGSLERGWDAVTAALKRAWDATLRIGRPTTMQERLGEIQQQIAERQANSWKFGGSDPGTDKLMAQRAAASRRLLREQDNALAEGQRKEEASAEIAAQRRIDKLGEAVKSNAVKRREEIAQLRKDFERTKRSTDSEEYRTLVAGINEKYKDKKAGPSTAGAERNLSLAEIQNKAKDDLGALEAMQRAQQLRRQAGLVDEQTYYAKRIEFAQQANTIEEGALRKEIELLEKQSLKGKEALEVEKQLSGLRSKLRLQQMKGENAVNEAKQDAATADERQRKALEGLNAESERYIANMQKRAAREVAAVGMSDRERAYTAGRQGIQDRFDEQRQSLLDRQSFTVGLMPEQKEQIKRRLALLEEERAATVKSYEDSYSQITRAQGSWEIGAQRAFANYADGAAKVADSVEAAFSNAFKGLEDALVSFATTGKADFKSLANSIIADLIRIQVRGALAGLFGKGDGFNWTKLLGGLAGAAGGGAAGGTPASSPSWTSVLSIMGSESPNWATGGYTGAGGKYQPAGIVHRGEYVMTKEATDRLGLGFLNRLNGYAAGGMVGAAPASNDVNWTILNHSSTPMTSETVQIDPQNRALVIRDARRAVAADVADANSRFSRTMARTTTASRRR